MRKRMLTVVAACAALALTLGACGRSGSSTSGDVNTVKIMVGGLDKQIYLPAKLTEQLGYFKQQGLNVQLSTEPAGVQAETAMLAGQVDGVVGFYDHTIDLQAKGKQVESVVQFAKAPGEVELVSSKQAGSIKSPADWRGKKLGVTGLGSSTNFLTTYLAVKNGVPAEQITPVAVGAGQTFIAAIQKGAIDGGMTTEPTVTQLLNSGQAKVLVDMRTVEGTRQALGGLYPAASLYMPASYVNSHKEQVQKLANAFVQTLKWMQSHSAAEITAKMPPEYYKGVGKAQYTKALEGGLGMFTADGVMPADGPPTVLKVLIAFSPNVKGRQIDLAKTYTTEFVTKANTNS
jgi:NitT/TauT family transport system substrate-binding protein